MFLLPSLQLTTVDNDDNNNIHSVRDQTTNAADATNELLPFPAAAAFGQLFVAILRLPFDRLRLVSGVTSFGAEAKEAATQSRQDLLEEETHMQLIGPAGEHPRAAYLASGGGTGTGSAAGQAMMLRSAQRSAGPEAGYVPADSVHGAGESAASDYGLAAADQGEGGPMGTVEGTSIAEPGPHMAAGGGSGGSAGLQTRGDLPAVRALNVKCEKNHMTVSWRPTITRI